MVVHISGCLRSLSPANKITIFLFLFIPSFLICFIFTPELRLLLTQKSFYIFFIFFFMPLDDVGGWQERCACAHASWRSLKGPGAQR